MTTEFDVIVIGGGPAGSTAAVYAARDGMKVAVFEKNVIGGQIVNSSKVENIPGFDDISGIEFGMNLESQLDKQNITIFYEEVIRIKFSDDYTKIKYIDCENGRYYAKAYIFATGCTNRTLGVYGEADLIGNGISFCALCDGPFYKDKTVAIIGGGNSALTEAIELSEIAHEVIVIQDLQELTAQKKLIDIASTKENIKIYKNLRVLGFYKYDDKIKIKLMANDLQRYDGPYFLVDGVFEAVGFIPETKLLEGSNLLYNNYAQATDLGQTVCKNMFAAGDVRSKAGIRQVVTACAEGAQAATTACEYIRGLKDE